MATPTGTLVRLDELAPHECAVVDHIEAPDDQMERLMSMGVCSGRMVELVMCGDPLILKVFGSRLGVSARLARRVMVVRCNHGSCRTPLVMEPDREAN